jgi:transcriptional regulator with GAF, ATPase, and Fis domain
MIEEESGYRGKAEEFLQAFKKGAEFTHDLLRENERLRYRVLELENSMAGSLAGTGGDQSQALINRIKELEQEKQDILDRIRKVEDENEDFANRYVEIEAENNNLANLYIASYQLHSTLDFKEVLQIIMEIVINLIGAEEFSLMLLDEKTGDLRAVACEGIEREDIPPIELGSGLIGQALQSGESYFTENIETYERDILRPMVCVPLKIKDHVIGVLAIYKLLIQKEKFAQVDYELFTLLAGHAATAIFGARLYSDSERRLSTIQGFIDLLTK